MKRVAVGGLLLTLALVVGSVPPLGADEKALPPADLVRRLSSAAYLEREEAAVRLARLGREAVPALRQGLHDSDPEVRRRCRELLPRAQRSDLDIRLDSFVTDGPGKEPLTGWTRFKECAGDDASARRLFVDLYRTERAVLEQLEKDPKPLAAQVTTRSQQLWQKLAASRGGDAEATSAGHVAALLLAAAVSPSTDVQSFWQINNVFYQQPVRALVQGQPAARRLVSRILAPRLADTNMLNQIGYLAGQLGLTELIEEKIKPAVRKQIETIKPDDWRFQQAAHLANQLEMHDLIETRIKPAVLDLAEKVLRQPDNQNRLYQAMNLVQTFQMKEAAENFLKPAALQYLKATAERPGDLNRIWQSRHLTQTLGLTEAFDLLVKPAVCRVVAEAAAHPDDQAKFQQALNLAQTLNLEEAFEGVLRPVGRRRILADLEQPADFNRLSQAANLARQLRLTDVLDDTLKPLTRQRAAALLNQAPEANRINQVYMLGQTLGMAELNTDVVKPALIKLCQTARDKPLDAAAFPQTLNLIKSLQVKEAGPLLLRGALAKEVNSWTRGMAIMGVAEFGAKEDVARLEPLLKDTTNCGAWSVNSTTINAEVRDVALAALIVANDQKLADYGFPCAKFFGGNKPTDIPPSCMGFPSKTEREAALKKWQEWSASRKK